MYKLYIIKCLDRNGNKSPAYVLFMLLEHFRWTADDIAEALRWITTNYGNPEVHYLDGGYGDCGTLYDQARIDHIKTLVTGLRSGRLYVCFGRLIVCVDRWLMSLCFHEACIILMHSRCNFVFD